MDYKFRFFKGRANVEKFRINVRDPVNGDRVENSLSLSKVELIVGAVVISTDSGEITWDGDVIQIKPLVATLLTLPSRSHSELVIYNGSEGVSISSGYVLVVDY
jgi:hypothetical protein